MRLRASRFQLQQPPNYRGSGPDTFLNLNENFLRFIRRVKVLSKPFCVTQCSIHLPLCRRKNILQRWDSNPRLAGSFLLTSQARYQFPQNRLPYITPFWTLQIPKPPGATYVYTCLQLQNFKLFAFTLSCNLHIIQGEALTFLYLNKNFLHFVQRGAKLLCKPCYLVQWILRLPLQNFVPVAFTFPCNPRAHCRGTR